jgi:lipopolysaccharide transport system ATP-binding protein
MTPISHLPSSSSTRSSDENEVLVRVENVSKKFCRDLKKSLWYGVCDITSELNPFRRGVAEDRASRKMEDGSLDIEVPCPISDIPTAASEAVSPSPISHLPSSSPNEALDSNLRRDEFYAVRDVSFELRRGECLGLIGRNGAGKTTLLKMLNGLIKPDSGKITMKGRIGALIALGAGFNPILTGRENVYVNGSVLGLTKKEIDAKFDEIVDFAEVEEFIDTPVRSYSSGMQVRLGFAVASTLDPDVLLLDEVLAVGDAPFRNKCYNRIGQLRKKASVIFVSHSMDQISMVCDKSLVVHQGRNRHFGMTAEGIKEYERLSFGYDDKSDASFEKIESPINHIQIKVPTGPIHYGENAELMIEVNSLEEIPAAVLRVIIYNSMQVPFAEWNSRRCGITLNLPQGTSMIRLSLGPLILKKGIYPLGLNLNDSTGIKMLCWSYKKHVLEVNGYTNVGPDIALKSKIDLVIK